jgi:hypothetical protein
VFIHSHYVPILKWKQGEYQALHRLAAAVKERIMPLIEIPPVGFDHEQGRARETIDAHLGDFGRRLHSKWQARPCFVDLHFIPPATRMADGSHFADSVFADARANGCATVPVIALAADAAFTAAIRRAIATDQRGVCLRIGPADIYGSGLAASITALLGRLGVSYPAADLVLDLGEIARTQPTEMLRDTMAQCLARAPALNRWRTVTVASTSYPDSVAQLRPPFDMLPRNEWLAYRELVNGLEADARIPTFGDYAVAHPEPVDQDMRLIKPFAKLRYTIDDQWHVGRGAPVRSQGFAQYRTMCATLMGQAYFSGAAFSAGDAYIAGCAAGTQPTGNLSTWVWVSTNRHLTKVAADLAKLHAL